LSDHREEAPTTETMPINKRRSDFLFVFLIFFAVLAVLFALVIASAVFLSSLLQIPLTIIIPSRMLPPNNQLYAAAGLLLLLALVFVLLARWRIRRNRAYQFLNGCPVCFKHDMIRVHRRRWHRLSASLLGLPIRMYACRNCQWQGILLYYPLNASHAEDMAWPSPAPVVSNQNNALTPEDKDLLVQSVLMANNDGPQNSPEGPTLSVEPGMPTPEEHVSHLAEANHHPPPEEKTKQVDRQPDNDIIDGALGQAVPLSHTSSQEGASAAESAHESDLIRMDVSQVDGSENGPRTVGRAIVVAPFGLSLRVAPSSTAEIILSLEPDTVVEILEFEAIDVPISWRHVGCAGETGWVSAAFLRLLQD
jgi:hypothetical protein